MQDILKINGNMDLVNTIRLCTCSNLYFIIFFLHLQKLEHVGSIVDKKAATFLPEP